MKYCYEIKSNGLPVKTKDGTPVLGSDFNVEIKELDDRARSFWAVASTESEDRDRDIIRVTGWELSNYRKNPVGLWCHNYFDHPHFKTEKIKRDLKNKKLIFKPIFDTHDKAQLTWDQFKNGFLTSFSVGFKPEEFSYRDENQRWDAGREFTKQELLEISAVPVPAHPDARIGLDAFGVEENTLLKLGFLDKSNFNEETGFYWVPIISDLEAYKEPKTLKLNDGITVVSAIPIFEKQENVISVPVGYYFNKDVFSHISDVNTWLEDNNIKNISSKFYFLDFVDDNIKLNLETEQKNIEVKGIEVNEDDVTETDFELDNEEKKSKSNSEDEEDPDMEDDTEEDGCGPKKPKKELDEEEVIEEKIIDEIIEENIGPVSEMFVSEDNTKITIKYLNEEGDIIGEKIYVEKVDNDLEKIVNSLQLKVKELEEEIKIIKEEMELSLIEDVTSGEENMVELDGITLEFPPVTQKDISDSEDYIEFEPEEVKNIVVEQDFLQEVSKQFENVFNQVLKESSGKLD
jgi:HK97 family phage prohead protease